MAYREVTMVEVKEVLRQWLGGEPKKRVAQRLSLSPRTVRRSCELAERHGARVQEGPSSLTDERLSAVMAELTTMRGRPHGATWALCVTHRETIARQVQNGVRLSKVRKLLLRSGIDVPYPTLHRFAVEELGFGRTRATVPVEDGEPGAELQVDTGWMRFSLPDERGRRRQLRVWIFTPSLSRYRFVWPCFSESTRSAIEACEAAWALLRRRLQGTDPRRHSARCARSAISTPIGRSAGASPVSSSMASRRSKGPSSSTSKC